jgi:hypothetical protein
MKLKNVQAYSINNVPDHLTQECCELGKDMIITLETLFNQKEPNIILGAIAFFQAAMIKNLVSDKPEEQKKAARMAAVALLKNVYFLNGLDLEDGLK